MWMKQSCRLCDKKKVKLGANNVWKKYFCGPFANRTNISIFGSR